MRTQRRGAAKVVCDDVRTREPPVLEQFAEYDVLYPERDVLVLGLLRFPVAQQVETVSGMCVGEVWSNAVPHVRGKRCAVYEYERGTRAPDRVANDLAPKAIGLVRRPERAFRCGHGVDRARPHAARFSWWLAAAPPCADAGTARSSAECPS